MALDATKWEIQNDKDIRYIGPAHTAAGANWVTVLELHRWVQDLADDATLTGDDYMDITRDTPSDKSFDTIINLINGFNIDDATAEYIYGGSIIQANGDTIYDGIQIVANAGVHVEIQQNGAVIANDFWNSIPNGSSSKGINPDSANGIAARFMVKVRVTAADIDGRRLILQTREWGKTYSEFKVNGTSRGVNVVPLTFATDLNNATAVGTVAGYDDVTNDRTTAGATVDGVNGQGSTTLNVTSGPAFSIGEFIAINDGAELGEYQITNIVTNALTITPGLDVATAGGETIWKIGYGYKLIDVNNDNTNEDYFTKWTRASRSINGFYERMKYLTRRGTTNRLFGLNGEVFRGITHEMVMDTLTGTFRACEAITWSGGTGRLLARVFPDTGVTALAVNASLQFTRASGSFITDGFRAGMVIVSSGFTSGGNNARKTISSLTATAITVTNTSGMVEESAGVDERIRSGYIWMQILTGTAPTDNTTITGSQSGATALVDADVTERALSFPWCGVSTGSAIIGAFGFGAIASDLSTADKVFDLTNTQYSPPNFVTFTVGGLVTNEDYVLVAPYESPNIDLNFFTLNGALTGGSVTSVVVNEAIPSDTPSSGTIRIQRVSGKYSRHPYSAYNTSTKTFTITAHDFSSDNAANGANCYPSYIDQLITSGNSLAFTGVYTGSDRSLFVRVRDGGGTPIKTFETTGTLGSAGGSSTAVRTSDA